MEVCELLVGMSGVEARDRRFVPFARPEQGTHEPWCVGNSLSVSWASAVDLGLTYT